MGETTVVRVRRPRDRKAQILTAAAARFARSGYHAVRMEEIAAAVGITAGALYRHFRGKQALLAAVVTAELDALVAALDAPLVPVGPALRRRLDATSAGELDDVLRILAAQAHTRRELGVLWARETRSLSPAQRQEVRQRLRSICARVARPLGAARPELQHPDVHLLARAVVDVFASPSYHRLELPRERFGELLHDAASSVCHTARLPCRGPRAPQHSRGPGRMVVPTRPESILVEAVRLFSERGFSDVSMDDIGLAAGIAGPSVYNHFPSKSHLLMTALDRGAQALRLGLNQALGYGSSPRHSLELAVRSYTRLALAHDDLVAVLVSEVGHLPEAQRQMITRCQYDHITGWAGLLSAERPDLTCGEARIVVHAALTMINHLSCATQLRRRPHLEGEVCGLALDVLGLEVAAGRAATPRPRPAHSYPPVLR